MHTLQYVNTDFIVRNGVEKERERERERERESGGGGGGGGVNFVPGKADIINLSCQQRCHARNYTIYMFILAN